jgi:hypothetical protein
MKRIYTCISAAVILVSACATPQKTKSDSLPTWVRSGSDKNTIICSHDALDPEEARAIAETKCLSSAAKLGGVQIAITSKSIDSLGGADASEVAEMKPLTSEVRCSWTNRYLESIDGGYRAWLACRVEGVVKGIPQVSAPAPPSASAMLPYKRATLSLATTPMASKVIVKNAVIGERVIDLTSNVQLIPLREGDESIEIRKQGYQPVVKVLGEWGHGQAISITVRLEPGL